MTEYRGCGLCAKARKLLPQGIAHRLELAERVKLARKAAERAAAATKRVHEDTQ